MEWEEGGAAAMARRRAGRRRRPAGVGERGRRDRGGPRGPNRPAVAGPTRPEFEGKFFSE
jgi:hypothetical protein